jgi:hypothetical protein
MKTKRPPAALISVFLLGSPIQSPAQTTAFTYQGSLSASGSPANGQYDFTFTGFNALTGGEIIGGPVTNAGILVSNGLFITTVNFGTTPFIGGGVWLEMAVRSNGLNGFTTLSPRQQITAVPYALYSLSAATAYTNAPAPNNAVTADSNGVVVTPSSFFAANQNTIASLLSGTFVSNHATGVSLSGTFGGNGTGLTNIQSASLVGTVPNTIQQVRGNGTNVRLTDSAFLADSSVQQTYIVNAGTLFGSDLGLVNLTHSGYSDINFYNDGYVDGNGNVQPVNLCGALGVGSGYANQFPYNEPYWELYDQYSFNWVQYAQIFGTVNGTNGDFVWYRNKTSDGDESTKMFEIVRPRTNVSFFVPIIISNTPSGPPASDIGANQAAAIWVSNGVVYIRTSTDGIKTSDKQIAP